MRVVEIVRQTPTFTPVMPELQEALGAAHTYLTSNAVPFTKTSTMGKLITAIENANMHRPPIEKIVLEITVEELRTLYACLATSTDNFARDVGVNDGYPLYEKIRATLEDIAAPVPNVGQWMPQR